MRGTSWWLSVAVLFALSACRLDLKGESSDEADERDLANREERPEPADRTAEADGRAVSTDSVFDHIEVRNAGMFTRSQVTIQNSSFSMSPGFGIVKTEANLSDYSTTNTFTGNVMGDVGMF